ncbi:MAG: hypothetical protein JNL98_02660 [Bryobacterales bacterium]|nr:hypothetical protein [Bryobacterales bacterium]
MTRRHLLLAVTIVLLGIQSLRAQPSAYVFYNTSGPSNATGTCSGIANYSCSYSSTESAERLSVSFSSTVTGSVSTGSGFALAGVLQRIDGTTLLRSETLHVSVTRSGGVQVGLAWTVDGQTQTLTFDTGEFDIQVQAGRSNALSFGVSEAPTCTPQGCFATGGSGSITVNVGGCGLFYGTDNRQVSLLDPAFTSLATGTGPTGLTTDLNQLKNVLSGRRVQGVAADGVARIIVAIPVCAAGGGQADVQLVDSSFQPVPNGGQGHGALGAHDTPLDGLFAGPGIFTLPLQGVFTDQQGGPMAIAVFRAPYDFGLADSSPSRTLYIKITRKWFGASPPPPQTLYHAITIVRPPVILVHGLWGNSNAWDFFPPLRETVLGLDSNTPFTVCAADYRGTNSAGFRMNAVIVSGQVARCLHSYRTGALTVVPGRPAIAVAQLDIIAHSMGGLIARTLSIQSDFLKSSNYKSGTIHKLITIASPHLGSQLANRLSASNDICQVLLGWDGSTVGDGVRDLSVGSLMIGSVLRQRLVPIKTHVIVGIASPQQTTTAEANVRAFLSLGTFCPSVLPERGFRELFAGDSDLIVADVSQQALLLGFTNAAAFGSFDPLVLDGVRTASRLRGLIHAVDPKLYTLGPDVLGRIIVGGQIVAAPPTGVPERVLTLLHSSLKLSGLFADILP